MPKRVLTIALAVCLFFLIVGAKWATFDRFGSPMPDWDQWDAEAVELFIPWFERDHFIAHLFHPHNEHRVVLTKLQNLALGLLNGQWDSRLEAVTNAMLHAALGVAMWLWACGRIAATAGVSAVGPVSGDGRKRLPLYNGSLFLLTAALFGLPLAWQNILGGFHSQQYWLLALSFAAIVILPFARAGSARWWIGAAASVLALGSMGSGFLAAAVVLVVLAWRGLRGDVSWRSAAPTLLLAAAVTAVGVLTRFDAPWHQDLKAKTAHDFVFSIIHSLQWPLRDHHWAGAIMWLPWVLIAWRVVRAVDRDTTLAASAQAVAALGGWTLVQIVATAYARGAGADYPASRYMDTLAFGAMVNGIALAWLLAAAGGNRLARVAQWLITAGWIATLAYGAYDVTKRNIEAELPGARDYYTKAESNMRRYLATNDRRHLANPDIPFPSDEALIERLANPHLRTLMPLPIRAPLPLKPAAPVPGFLENDARAADPRNPPRAGLSPQTPPLDAAVTWGSFIASDEGAAPPRTWRSQPITPTLRGWLKFETAGQTGNPNEGVLLELHDAQTDALIARIRPDRVPGDSWRAAYVRTPARPFVVVAHDNHPARWLAFSGPVEMGWLSHWAWLMTRRGLLVMYAAAFGAVLLAAFILSDRRRGEETVPAPAAARDSSPMQSA